MKFLKKEKGFTLIELLVVVSIIGVLATIVLSALGEAREKAKIAKLQRTIGELQNSLELYYSDYGRYPTNATGQLYICGYHSTQSTSNAPVNILQDYYPTRDIDTSLIYNPYYGCIRIITSPGTATYCDNSNLKPNAQSYIIYFRGLGVEVKPYWEGGVASSVNGHCAYSI